MNHMFEPLEGRTLFSVTIPASVTATYQPVIDQLGLLQADSTAAEESAGNAGGAIVSDEKALGHNKQVIALVVNALLVENQTINGLKRATANYVKGAQAEFVALERLDTTATNTGAAGPTKRYDAAVQAATKSEPRRVAVLRTAIDKANGKLAAALTILASSTGASDIPALQVALRSTASSEQSVVTDQDSTITNLANAVDTALKITPTAG